MHCIFGPVHSRRLGWSLGINNLPDKICSYSCAYCQVGTTRRRTICRSRFFSPGTLYKQARARLEECAQLSMPVDYITLVPNGEPTLDKNLQRTIGMLKQLGPGVAVLTNASLLWMKHVRNALHSADWVSLKVDCVQMDCWKRLNRPNGNLNIHRIMGGMLEFRDHFPNYLTSETMIVRGFNDHWSALESTAKFLSFIRPDRCYLSIPVRPPADLRVKVPMYRDMDVAEKLFHVHGLQAQRLMEETNGEDQWPFDLMEQLIDIAAVHPVDEGSVVQRFGTQPGYRRVLDRLLREGKLQRARHLGKTYFVSGKRESVSVRDD